MIKNTQMTKPTVSLQNKKISDQVLLKSDVYYSHLDV